MRAVRRAVAVRGRRAVPAALAFGWLLTGCGTPSPAPEPVPVLTSPDAADADRRARLRLDLAQAYLARGQDDTALDEVRLALQARPDLAEGHALRAMILGARGDQAAADAAFARARALAPRDGALLHNQGWYLCQSGRPDDAQAAFSAALALPGYRDAARTQLSRGICFGRAGKWLEAEGALSRAFELDPGNPHVAYNLAEVLLRRGEPDRARPFAARLNAQAAARNAQSLWLAARIEHAAGQADRTRDFGEQLMQEFPQSNEAARWQRGQFDDR